MFLRTNVPDVLGDISADEMLEVLRAEGFGPEIDSLSDGEPFVRFKVEGYGCSVFFYWECEDKKGRFRSIQFSAVFRDKISVDRANEWNSHKRFVRVYSDKDGDLCFSYDVALDGGVAKQFLAERVTDWKVYFNSVMKFMFE